MLRKLLLSSITVTFLLGDVAASGASDFVFRYRPGVLTVAAQVQYPSEPKEPETPPAPEQLSIPAISLSHIDSDGNGFMKAGETVRLAFAVRNDGNERVTGVAPTARFSSYDPNTWQIVYENDADYTMSCSGTAIASGDEISCTVQLTLTQAILSVTNGLTLSGEAIVPSIRRGVPPIAVFAE